MAAPVASDATGRALRTPQSRAFAVLVGGEGRKHHLGFHCSVEFVGQAYAALAPILGPDNIIVICQLKQV